MKSIVITVLLFRLFAFTLSMPAKAKVIGSAVVESIESFPYQTAIFAQKDESTAAFCSGSILSENFVLTCAHCLVGSSYASVFYGSRKLSALDNARSQIVNSTNYRIHPKYSEFINDIALIELPVAIEFSGKKIFFLSETFDLKFFMFRFRSTNSASEPGRS